ncbi:hypothetical protein [Actinomadura decatromicini]|uniref:DUF485 domain-containing protein n=1 Tax=Actinomadura decatromicini TaxID=2604572 RepID=A0A5D3FIZ8_9ACTN|nr:hypothetical protein [Actinomadura decatromicini]TYK47952.1 hypothetical protein FXF68_19880 [Actinomadura decatromicini]
MTGDQKAARAATAAPRERRPPGGPGPGPSGADRSGADPDDSGGEPPDPDPPHPVPGPAEARALIRVQLGIALRTGAVVLAAVAGLPALLALVPAVARIRADGVPVWWTVLAAGLQPLWVATALWQLKRAERAERATVTPTGTPPRGASKRRSSKRWSAKHGATEHGAAEQGAAERGAAGHGAAGGR